MPVTTQKLTDKTVTAARAETGKRLELWDEATPGLCLRVSDTGKKVWVWRYRTDDGRQPRLTLGDHSTKHGLKWAREEVEDLRVKVRKGADPAEDRRKAKREAKAQTIRTFNDLADAYLLACETGKWKPKGKHKRASTLSGETGSLRLHIRPVLGKSRVETITRADIKRLLWTMVEDGKCSATNRAHAVIRQCFAFAISEDRVPFNPAIGFTKLVTVTKRERVLTDAEMGSLWAALIDPTGLRLPAKDGRGKGVPVYVGRPMRIAVQLAMLLLQRRGEIAGMRLSEFDLDHATWLIPAERMKGGIPHVVPLPPLAVALIREALDLGSAGMTDEERRKAPNDRPVFPSPRDAGKSVKPDSLTHAVVNLAAALNIADATPHDLRRTGSTLMTSERLGVTHFIRSKVLGHQGDTGGGSAVSVAHYDANTYAPDKRRALAAWEGLLLEIVGAPGL